MLEEQLLRLTAGRIARGERPVIGLNGPVGAGKSTFSQRLQQCFAAEGLRLAVASIDDAYLPWQQRLEAMAGNPFGVNRVPPGSHEPERLVEAIAAWRGGLQGTVLRLPRFDKRLRQGQGDRTADWQGSAQALLLEGWLVGCEPVAALDIAACTNNDPPELKYLSTLERRWLPQWNHALEAYRPLWRQLDQLVMLWPVRWQLPRRWRFQAEARQRARGGGWMPPQQLESLVRSSLCSLPPPLYQRPLVQRADLVRVLDGRRRSLWEGSGAEAMGVLEAIDEAQASSPSSSATG
jgi:D-glycerate 3-kinase